MAKKSNSSFLLPIGILAGAFLLFKKKDTSVSGIGKIGNLLSDKEAYKILVNAAKKKGAKKITPIIPNYGSIKDIEIPDGFNCVGIESLYYKINEKGNTVSWTEKTYQFYDGENHYYIDRDWFN